MKKFLILVAVVVAAGIFPVAAYADAHHGRPAHHDQSWRNHHDRQWKDHEREWKEHDREWKEHRWDRRWREAKAREWREWYQWHRDNDNDSEFHLRIAGDNFELDIDR